MRDKKGFILGFPFDQLLNLDCPLVPISPEKRQRGIILPDDDDPGSGNIIIKGVPGAGKSTLALQFAVKCAALPANSGITAFISLENTPSEIRAKAEAYSWDNSLHETENLRQVSELSSEDEYADLLLKVLEKTDASGTRSIKPCVLLPILSPRPLHADSSDDLFWKRYNQLERLLSAGYHLNDKYKDPENPGKLKGGENIHFYDVHSVLKLVVIDSLNMFTSKTITREEMHQLFRLFKKYNTIGVFTVESNQNIPFDSTLADTVISLQMTKENGYFMRYFEIEKSRYGNHVLGQHPFKTIPLAEKKYTPSVPIPRNGDSSSADEISNLVRHGIVPYPSLHYVISKTGEKSGTDAGSSSTEAAKDTWCIEAFKLLLPKNLMRGSVVTIEGPRGTFKTNLALTFIADGLMNKEDCILIHLHDSPVFRTPVLKGPPISKELSDKGFKWSHLIERRKSDNESWQNLANPEKAQFTVLEYKRNNEKTATLFEIDFKSGNLLPEEFIHYVREVIIRKNIKRVVLDDISEIGAAYPFLLKSQTSNNIFLPVFAHLMRNHGIDLVITGTSEGLKEGIEVVDRACTISDTVISCKYCDVFGDRYITIEGEGLTIRSNRISSEKNVVKNEYDGFSEYVPGVIIPLSEETFEVDMKRLQGLVGFNTGNVQRPDLLFYTFQEMKLHRHYNNNILNALTHAFGNSQNRGMNEGGPGISQKNMEVESSVTEDIKYVMDSLDILSGKPVNRTIIATVDEFYLNQLNEESGEYREFKNLARLKGLASKRINFIEGFDDYSEDDNIRPYYANVLLLAYRKKDEKNHDILTEEELNEFIETGKKTKIKDWQSVGLLAKKIAGKLKENTNRRPGDTEKGTCREFEYFHYAGETLCSIFIDMVLNLCDEDKLYDKDKKKLDFSKILATVSRDKKDDLFNELEALKNLLQQCEGLRTKKPNPDDEINEISENAAVYLCWYTQLRELLDDHPELAGKIGVCALPAGGFRGDWFLGVANGSVSIELGEELIRILTSKKEEYRRLDMGVGLPVRKEFYEVDCFDAWPGSDVPLSELKAIHDGARSKKNLEGYRNYWLMLFSFCKKLTTTAEQPQTLMKALSARISSAMKFEL